jgi:hypothetical protein
VYARLVEVFKMERLLGAGETLGHVSYKLPEEALELFLKISAESGMPTAISG